MKQTFCRKPEYIFLNICVALNNLNRYRKKRARISPGFAGNSNKGSLEDDQEIYTAVLATANSES